MSQNPHKNRKVQKEFNILAMYVGISTMESESPQSLEPF